jgi:hypothetical protein
MILQNMLLAIALSLQSSWYPPGKSPETVEQYQDRLKIITQAIAMEAQAQETWQWGTDALAAATLATWYEESRFALEVHNGSGRTRFGEDNGRARCFGQLHQTGFVPKQEWKTLTGTDLESTRRCARATMRVLSAQGARCKMPKDLNVWSVARMFAMYGTGRSCSITKNSMKRARHWGRIMSEFAKQTEPTQPSLTPTARLD